MENKFLEDRRLSMLLFFVVYIMYLIVYMTKNCYSAAMAMIVSEGVLTKTQTGTITAAFYIVYALCQLPGGAAADRFSPGNLILIGLLGAGTANLIIYFNQNYTVMIAVWAINGAVQFGVWPSVFKITSTGLAKEHCSMGVFYIGTASSAGLFFSYILAGLVSKWQYNFLLSAVLLFVTAVIWVFLWNFLEKQMIAAEDTGQIRRQTKKLRRTAKNSGFFRVFMSSGLCILLIVTLIRCMLDIGVKSLAPVMLVESYEWLSPSFATALNTLLIIAGVCGLFFFKFLFPKRISNEATTLTLLLAFALPAFAVVMLLGKIPLWMIIAALILAIAMTSGGALIGSSYLALHFIAEGHDGKVAGIFNAGATLGIVLANYGFAKIADSFGWQITVRLYFALAAVSVILCSAAVPLWKQFLKKAGSAVK